jgi:hypothetical protein
MQATRVFGTVEISRRTMAILVIAPAVTLMLGGVGGYGIKAATSPPNQGSERLQPLTMPVPGPAVDVREPNTRRSGPQEIV